MKKLAFMVLAFLVFPALSKADDNADYAAEVKKRLLQERKRLVETLYRARMNTILHLGEYAAHFWEPQLTGEGTRADLFVQSRNYCHQVFVKNIKESRRVENLLEGYITPAYPTERKKLLELQEIVNRLAIDNNVFAQNMKDCMSVPIAPRLNELLSYSRIEPPEGAPDKLKSLAQAEWNLREAMVEEVNLIAQLLEAVPAGSKHEKIVFVSRDPVKTLVESCYEKFLASQLASRQILGQLALESKVDEETVTKAIKQLAAEAERARAEILTAVSQMISQIKIANEGEYWLKEAGLR